MKTPPKIPSLKSTIATLDTRQGSSAVVPRIRGWALTKIIKRISERDGYRCQICGRVTIDGEVHHKTPLFLGGAEADFNRVYICKACHEAITIKDQKTRDNIY
jgi:5-methylcytosine-specific restriction endonuclease McrA